MLNPRDNDWYDVVNTADLEQGDILSNCPIFLIDKIDIPDLLDENGELTPVFDVVTYDVIVLTQSCDLQLGQGRQKIQHVVLCPIEKKSNIEKVVNHVLSPKGMLKKASKGEHPGFFVIEAFADSAHISLDREIGVVHFQQVYTLPVAFLRDYAAMSGPRLRLKSPYREALSNRFASFFGRVALKNPVRIQ